MGDARGGHHAGGLAGHLCQVEGAHQLMAEDGGAVAAGDVLVHADDAHVRLHTGHHGGHGAGRVGGLGIDVVGLGQGRVGEAVEAEHVLLPHSPLELAGEDAGGGDRGHAHAVADEEDDILGPFLGLDGPLLKDLGSGFVPRAGKLVGRDRLRVVGGHGATTNDQGRRGGAKEMEGILAFHGVLLLGLCRRR